MNLFERIADLLDIEPHQLIVVSVAGIAAIAIMLLAWYLYWNWMFSFFGK